MFTRTDIPLADQMVQVGHVCQVAGTQFEIPEHCNLVLLGIDSEVKLNEIKELLLDNTVEYVSFYEPDSVVEGGNPMGETALCTQPISGSKRSLFRKFDLWKA